MGKLDQVSESIGELKSSMKSISNTLNSHHKSEMRSIDKIENHLRQLNDSIIKHENRLSTLEKARWTWKRASLVVGTLGGLFSLFFIIIQIFLGVL